MMDLSIIKQEDLHEEIDMVKEENCVSFSEYSEEDEQKMFECVDNFDIKNEGGTNPENTTENYLTDPGEGTSQMNTVMNLGM